MIFYNNQLMSTREEATLFMVSNPISFSNYDDHEAGIYIQLHELVERAIAEGEDPVMLIEEYLETVYVSGHTIEEIVAFLFENDKMIQALWSLQQNWENIDETLPEDSLMYGGIDKQEAIQLYSEITLRSYLSTLSNQAT